MNIWSQKKKQREADAQKPEKQSANQGKQQPLMETPKQIPVEEIIAPTPAPADVDTPLPGLNDLFDMTDNDLRKLSPTGNFSKLKTTRPKNDDDSKKP